MKEFKIVWVEMRNQTGYVIIQEIHDNEQTNKHTFYFIYKFNENVHFIL